MQGGKHTWESVPLTFDPYWFYAGLDCVWTYGVHQQLLPRVQAVSPLAYDLERGVSAVCARMEAHGALVDQVAAEEYRTQLDRYVREAATWCVENYGVKPGSNAEVVRVLEGEGFEFDKVTRTGAKALDKEVLGEIDHPLARVVLARRQAQKVASTFLRHFIDDVDEDSRLHPNVNTCEARTSRMSMDSPNLQQLPRVDERNPPSMMVRNCIISGPGHTLLMCDFNQIEWRLFASLAKDDKLQTAFQADDFFTEMVRQVFQDPEATRKDPRRQTTKNAMYARIYGAGTAKFAWTAGISEDEAQRFTALLDFTYPSIRQFTRRVENTAQARRHDEGEAYVRSPLTRRRFVIDDDSTYKLVNYLIQGTAAEVLKMKLIELAAAGLGDYLVCPVHDEVILEVPDEDVDDVAHTVLRIMNDQTLFAVPITASLSTGKRWGEKVDWQPTTR
jgi:DNA polymerase-1